MTIAITAATGQLGRLVVARLAALRPDQPVVALVRSPARAADLGVPAREADYARPQTLAAALDGVDRLLLISSNEVGQRALQHRNVIDAARRSGVRHVVYTSLLRAATSPLSLAAEHAETERALADSGLAFTILRNGWYSENYMASAKAALAAGAVIGSAGTGRIASAARADYAEAAAVVLSSTAGHAGRSYELAGDQSWTLADLAAEISRQSGRTIPYRDLPPTDYAAALAGMGLPEALAQAIAGWDVAASQGALFDDGRQLSRLIGRPTTPLAATVGAALA